VDAERARSGATGAVLGQICVGVFPREVAGDDMALLVSNYSSASISGIDLTGLAIP
jgi:hypothetical protein